jgi:hypothetical protein
MNDDYIYTPATTDVTIRWRKLYNWIPPSEDPTYQKKWADFRAMVARSVESIAPHDVKSTAKSSTIIKWKK